MKFIGDQADNSRGSISDETKEKFKKAMMEQPGANFAIPSTDEEDIKKQVGICLSLFVVTQTNIGDDFAISSCSCR